MTNNDMVIVACTFTSGKNSEFIKISTSRRTIGNIKLIPYHVGYDKNFQMLNYLADMECRLRGAWRLHD